MFGSRGFPIIWVGGSLKSPPAVKQNPVCAVWWSSLWRAQSVPVTAKLGFYTVGLSTRSELNTKDPTGFPLPHCQSVLRRVLLLSTPDTRAPATMCVLYQTPKGAVLWVERSLQNLQTEPTSP